MKLVNNSEHHSIFSKSFSSKGEKSHANKKVRESIKSEI